MKLTFTGYGIFVLVIVGVILISGCAQAPAAPRASQRLQNETNATGQPTIQLEIPDDSLPEGVTAEEVQAKPIRVEEIPEKWQWLEGTSAFLLEPDGIEFKNPITLTITASAEDGTLPRLFLVSEEEAEELKDVQISFDPAARTVTAAAKVSHFSVMLYRKKASVKTVLDRGASDDSSSAQAYFKECLETFNIMEDLCKTYENWKVVHDVSVKDFRRKYENSYEDFIYGPNNKCEKRAGDVYPLRVISKTLDAAKSGGGTNIEVICTSSCFGWECPPGEAELEKNYTCTGINMYKSAEACANSKWCKSRQCVRDETQFDCWTCTTCPAGDPTDICVLNCGLRGGICREVSPGCSVCETCQTGIPAKQCALTCEEIGGTCKQVSQTPDCSICCTPSWSCTEWSPSTCPSSGVQTRKCTDANDCGTNKGKPAESQACTPPTCDTNAVRSCLSNNCVAVYGPGGSANCPERCKVDGTYDTSCLTSQCNTPYQNCIAACHSSNPPCTMSEVYAVLEQLSS